MINFQTLTLEGFGSIINSFTYNLNIPGINVLQARNGIGKTTIFSGLSWVIYGRTLKSKKANIQTWPDKRGKNFRGTRGGVIFHKDNSEYQIIRLEKYKEDKKAISDLQFYKDGKLYTNKGKVEIQKEIIFVLGYSFDLFRNSAIFGQKMKRIIEEDGPTKKKVFDEAFDIEYIQRAKKDSEVRRDELNRNLSKITDNLNSKLQEYKTLKRSIKDNKKILRNFEKMKEQRISSELSEKKKYVKTLNALVQNPMDNNKIGKLNSKLNFLNTLKEEVEAKSLMAFKKDMEIQNTLGDIDNEKAHKIKLTNKFKSIIITCKTCGAKLSKDLIKKEKVNIKKEIGFSKQRIILLNKKHIEIQSELDSFGNIDKKKVAIKDRICNITNKLSDKKAEHENYFQKLSHTQNKIRDIDSGILKIREEKLPNDMSWFYGKKKKLKISIVKSKEEITRLRKDIEILNWLIKDPLSNSGIKAFIFDQMLLSVNGNLKQYASVLGFKINFGVDLESSNKDFYISLEQKNNIRMYDDLSGGEQQLINICIAFAVHDTICQDKDMNLLVMDEVFENLDPENIEIVSNLIAQKSQGKSVHIITHHRDFNPTHSNIIHLKKKNGNTHLAV
jgi:DNA repair exonuclease SbcCD ATPase subunit